jgi:hypothetical protein
MSVVSAELKRSGIRSLVARGDCSLPISANSCLLDDFLDAADGSVFEHDFDAVGMLRGFGEDSLNDALCQLSAVLMLFLHNTHFHSWLDLRSSLTIHSFIMVQNPYLPSTNSRRIIHGINIKDGSRNVDFSADISIISCRKDCGM